MKVSIVIPNWNGAGKLKKNLPKVLETKGVDEIIISDDASTDESVEILEKDFPQIKLVKRKKNSGFSTNANNGVKNAEGDLVFLLNTDAVPEKNCLEKVIAHFNNPKVFSIGFNTGGNWSWARFEKGYFWHYQAPRKNELQIHQTLWASGGSGVFRKSIWEALGGFDELFNPFYEEDMDLGYRATKRGYINLWDSNAKVEHYREPGVISQHFSKEQISKVAQRNQLIFIWKNITSEKLINEHKKALIKKLASNPKYLSVFTTALIRLPKVLEKRGIEKKEAVLTDEQILGKFSLN